MPYKTVGGRNHVAIGHEPIFGPCEGPSVPDTPGRARLPGHFDRLPGAAVTTKRLFDPTSAPGSAVSSHLAAPNAGAHLP
jgi:hypothetical protein